MRRLRLWWSYKVMEKFWQWLAFRLPKKLAYWATIRVGAHATQGEWSHQVVPDLYFMDAVKRWDE